MAEKQLLIEASEFGLICNLSNDEKNRLTESLKVSKRPNDCLLVKGVPSTRLDIKNQNGRIYPTALMQKAIEEARPQMESKMLVCSGDEHPTDSTFPRPSTISHVVVNAYIKNVLIVRTRGLGIRGEGRTYFFPCKPFTVLSTQI